MSAVARADDLSRQVLSEMNFARTSPREYASVVATVSGGRSPAAREAIDFLKRAKPLPALTYSGGLSAGARAHVADQGSRGAVGHAGSDRSQPWDRVERFGSWLGTVGENIAYGHRSARQIVCALIIDEGVRGRGHRKNIFSREFGVAGVATGGHVRFGTMCVTDFAGEFVESGSGRLAAGNVRSFPVY